MSGLSLTGLNGISSLAGLSLIRLNGISGLTGRNLTRLDGVLRLSGLARRSVCARLIGPSGFAELARLVGGARLIHHVLALATRDKQG